MAAQHPPLPITNWSISETMDYLKSTIGDNNCNIVQQTQSCQYLLSKLRDQNNVIFVLKNSGLDLVGNLLGDIRARDDSKAISSLLIIAITALCANPTALKYPITQSAVGIMDYLKEIYSSNLDDTGFIINCCNAICNFCNNNQQHQQYAIKSSICFVVIDSMNKHRGELNGDKVHLAGCLALRNVGCTYDGQKHVGSNGVKAIQDGIIQYFDDFNVIKGSLGVLCNLCIYGNNGKSFIESDGIKLFNKIYDDACKRGIDAIRLACASMLHNLSANEIAAPVLATYNDGEGIGLMMRILCAAADENINSALFSNSLKALAALLFKLKNDVIKINGMRKVIDCGLLTKCNAAIQSNNTELQELVSTTLVVIVQTNKHLAQQIVSADCHGELIKMILKSNCTTQTKHCSMTIFFHITDNYKNQINLMNNGLLDLLASDWYKGNTKDDTIRVGCNLLVKLLGNVKNYDHFNKKPEYKPNILSFCQWCEDNKDKNISDQCKSIKQDINSIKPST